MKIQLISPEDVISITKWIPIIKSYRYELQPIKNQEVKCIKTLDTLRHLYNWSLGERIDAWKNGKWSVQYKHQQNYLTVLRNKNDDFGKDLQEVYTDVEQNQLKRVDLGFDKFFDRIKKNKKNPKKYKKPGHPRFKSRNRMKSFTYTRYGYGCHILNDKREEDINGNILRLSKIGDIKFIKHTPIGDPGIPFQIKTITIKKEVDKLIFIPVIETFKEIEIPIILDVKGSDKDIIQNIEELKCSIEELNKKCVGNDMGLPKLISDSNGIITENPKYLEKSTKRLRKEQQKLSRKQRYDIIDDETGKVKRDPKTNKKIWKGSKNRDKQVIKVAKVHRYIKNQRRDSDHVISKKKVKDNDLNVFEKLEIQKMMKNHIYAKRIADSGWSQVQRFTSYKAEWAGKKVDFVDPAYTSQACSSCGRLIYEKWIDRENEIFYCPFCNLNINIHVNAAKNIRNRSPVYQQKLDSIYQILSRDMKDKIRLSENRLKDNIYCWSLDPEDSWNDDNRISRDAAARIYAFGEMASIRSETVEQVILMNKETASNKSEDCSKLSSDNPRPLGRGS